MNAPAPAVHISLHSYLKQIEGVIKRSFAEHIWVVAELSEFNIRNGGTCWFTLIESADGKETAKCSAVMFGSVSNVQLRAFEQVTERRERPRTFSAGMDSAGSEAALQSPYPYLLMA
ncbi:exodeoxyribonuclease VII large subunit [Pseudomonas luteola]